MTELRLHQLVHSSKRKLKFLFQLPRIVSAREILITNRLTTSTSIFTESAPIRQPAAESLTLVLE